MAFQPRGPGKKATHSPGGVREHVNKKELFAAPSRHSAHLPDTVGIAQSEPHSPLPVPNAQSEPQPPIPSPNAQSEPQPPIPVPNAQPDHSPIPVPNAQSEPQPPLPSPNAQFEPQPPLPNAKPQPPTPVPNTAPKHRANAAIAALCQALSDLGLGYLHLGQSSNTLSRGEAQRIKLATHLGKPLKTASVLLLDEPDRGLHPTDIRRLLDALSKLVQAGHTVLAVSHHPMVWHAADHRFALEDGRQTTPSPLPSPPRPFVPEATTTAAEIVLEGVRTHNLQNLNVRIAHGKVTAVVGPSGSGKSSLVFDTLAALGLSRFAETLPFQVRRALRQLPAPDLDRATGLTPVLALKQGQGRAGARATVGTLTGLDANLRLLWSRLGTVDGVATTLSAAHFSPNQSIGACESCAGRGTLQRCDPERLVSHPERSLADGAMSGTKPGAFFGEADGQYLATLQVAAKAAGVDVSGVFSEFTDAARTLALYGSGDQIYDVQWHYQRGKRSGTHAFTGPWVGLCALVEHEAKIRAKRKNAADWAVPLANVNCGACGGARLSVQAREVILYGLSLPALAREPLDQVARFLRDLMPTAHDRPVLDAIRRPILARIHTLNRLGLGHLGLDRSDATLSTGERQRLRLSGVLDSELTGLTLVLDEPGTGLPDDALTHLAHRLQRFCAEGNTVVMVAHRQVLIERADAVIALGPGAGSEGGRVVPHVVDISEVPRRDPPAKHGLISIRGACANTLQSFDLDLPDRGLVAIHGPSGSGKSTLLFAVIGASVAAATARGCAEITGLSRFTSVQQTRSMPVQTPLVRLQLLKPMQKLFHGVGSGLSKSAFSFHSAAGRCATCKGAGQSRVPMDFMADVILDCERCQGRRYNDQVLAVRWQGLSVADFLQTPVSALEKLPLSGPLKRAVQALIDVGLSHLSLGQRGHVLSGGEHQRVMLASALCGAKGPTLFLLDEPGSGLSETDLSGLIRVLHRLADRGDLVICTSHRQQLIDAADAQVSLGPGPERPAKIT